MGRKLAAEFGLDEGLLQGLSNAGANISDESSFSFSIVGPQLKVWSDRTVQNIYSNAACAQAIGSRTLLIVRGYVIGQRKFSTQANAKAVANAGVAQIGNFKIDAGSGSGLNITDDASQSFLQILSEVTPPPSAAATASVTAPQPVEGVGRIYVQQDSSDDASKGNNIVATLKGSGFNVESHVEGTSSSRTPTTAQVRYFNDSDKEKANRVLESLKQQYPEATLMPLKIQAPQGQLEVWLPRAKQ